MVKVKGLEEQIVLAVVEREADGTSGSGEGSGTSGQVSDNFGNTGKAPGVWNIG